MAFDLHQFAEFPLSITFFVVRKQESKRRFW
jgi:hypothetical protein